MYFALDEFFLQRTQQYTQIKNLVNAPTSTIGEGDRHHTL